METKIESTYIRDEKFAQEYFSYHSYKCHTDRLILRRYCKDDLRDLFEYLSDAEVVKYEPYKPMSLAKVSEELDMRISSDEMIAVVLKETNKLIGNIYFGKREFNSLEI